MLCFLISQLAVSCFSHDIFDLIIHSVFFHKCLLRIYHTHIPGIVLGDRNISMNKSTLSPWCSHSSDFPQIVFMYFLTFCPFSKMLYFLFLLSFKINFAWDTISTNVLGFSLSFFTDQIAGNFTWFASELHILLIMEVIWCTWFGLIYIIFWLSYILAFWPLHLFKGRE